MSVYTVLPIIEVPLGFGLGSILRFMLLGLSQSATGICLILELRLVRYGVGESNSKSRGFSAVRARKLWLARVLAIESIDGCDAVRYQESKCAFYNHGVGNREVLARFCLVSFLGVPIIETARRLADDESILS